MSDLSNELRRLAPLDHSRVLGDAMCAAADEIERLQEYREHHEFVMSQLAEMLKVKISVVGDLVEVFQEQQAAIERLRNAASIFRTYGLPPVDVSGLSEWNRALSLLTEAAKAGGDDEWQ